MSYLYGLVLVTIFSALITKMVCLHLNLALFKLSINKATNRCIKEISTKFDAILHLAEDKNKENHDEIELLYKNIKEDIELLFIDYMKSIERY
jgi:hypothetical protein